MRRSLLGLRLGGIVCLLSAQCAIPFPVAKAADDKAAPEKRVAVATCATGTASLLRREAPDKPWQIIKDDEQLFSGDEILGGVAGAVDSLNGAVRLIVVGDVDGQAPLPILETAFTLHEAKDSDLDVTLERGRIRLINIKKAGAAKVMVRVRETAAEVTLDEPGATLSMEIYGRWPRGVPFRKEPKAGEEPAIAFTLIAIKGDIDIKGPRRQIKLKAPPGLAMLDGDTLGDQEPAAGYLQELPKWAPEHLSDMGSTELGKKKLERMAQFRKLATDKGLNAALDDFLASDDPLQRRYAILLLVATDNMQRLGEVLRQTTHQDVWDTAIVSLRNWIGRGPGQDQKLHKRLQESAGYSPREAEAVLELLHSFSDDELSHPETYQMLISYLGSERPTLRQLAYWHLYRLMPAGRTLGYDPMAPKEKRDAVIKEWRKLEIPHQSGEK
jgi:hypothetical protein